MYKRGLIWFRQDLRIQDNTALLQASKLCEQVIPIFILNHQVTQPRIEDDKRLGFLYAHLEQVAEDLHNLGSYLVVDAGVQKDMIQHYLDKYECDALFYNRSYGPGHDQRDKEIYDWCFDEHIQVETYDDYLLMHPAKVPTRKVYTPFYKKRLPLVEEAQKNRSDESIHKLSSPRIDAPDLDSQKNFFSTKKHTHRPVKNMLSSIAAQDLHDYNETRNIPSIDGTTKLSPYLRFGAVSPRKVFTYFHTHKNPGHEIIVKELAWREFWQHIAYHFPYAIQSSFQEKRRHIERDNNKEWFEAWKQGKTGYPLVDAGMRQLREENRMHNRVRMVVASFLTKDLLIDRKRGAQHFADYLLDHDRNVNTGNRQRSASVGADPKPLRIFNPILQSKRFDPECEYILKYVPELEGQEKKAIHDPITHDLSYTPPLVDHYIRRKKAMERYNTSKARYEQSLEQNK